MRNINVLYFSFVILYSLPTIVGSDQYRESKIRWVETRRNIITWTWKFYKEETVVRVSIGVVIHHDLPVTVLSRVEDQDHEEREYSPTVALRKL